MNRRAFVAASLGLILCAYSASMAFAQDPTELRGYFYGIAGDDVIGMGVGYSISDTYVGLEWTAKDTVEYGQCDKSEQSFTIALTPGFTELRGKTRFGINAILGYYDADHVDTCLYPARSSDSGLDYGLGVSMSVLMESGLGYTLGLRYTDSSEAGFTFGISW